MTRNGDDVAVKLLLPNSSLDYGQLKNEFYNLRKINHQNIVQVLGYCFETEQKAILLNGIKVFVDEIRGALCLEYMHNGSLQQHLSGTLMPYFQYVYIVTILIYLHLIKNPICLPLLQMSFLDLNGTHGSK